MMSQMFVPFRKKMKLLRTRYSILRSPHLFDQWQHCRGLESSEGRVFAQVVSSDLEVHA